MENLFIYGTLINPYTQREILGRRLEFSKDILEDYEGSRVLIKECVHPVIFSKNGSSIEGFLTKVSEEELIIIDKYKGKKFERARVQLKSGNEAFVYVGISPQNL